MAQLVFGEISVTLKAPTFEDYSEGLLPNTALRSSINDAFSAIRTIDPLVVLRKTELQVSSGEANWIASSEEMKSYLLDLSRCEHPVSMIGPIPERIYGFRVKIL